MPRMAWRRSSRSSSSHAVWRRLTGERDVTRTAALAPATKSEASPLQALIAPQPYMGLSLSSTNFSAHAFFLSPAFFTFRDQLCIHTAVPLLGRAEQSTKAQRIAPKAQVGLTAKARAELLLSHCFAPGTSGTLTRYEAEPAWSGQVIVATSLYSAGISTVDSQTMMQIYASAARLRSSGAHSCIRHESHWLWRATATSDRCLARRYSAVPRLMIFPVLLMFLCSQVDACSLKPSGTIPVFT
jgi:hypothetical protein